MVGSRAVRLVLCAGEGRFEYVQQHRSVRTALRIMNIFSHGYPLSFALVTYRMYTETIFPHCTCPSTGIARYEMPVPSDGSTHTRKDTDSLAVN